MLLQELPEEIIASVCALLCPHCQAVPGPEPCRPAECEEIIEAERKELRSLANLGLTSRRLYASAVPFLYHRPLPSGITGTVSLMRTIMANSELAGYVQSVVLTDWREDELAGRYRVTHWYPIPTSQSDKTQDKPSSTRDIEQQVPDTFSEDDPSLYHNGTVSMFARIDPEWLGSILTDRDELANNNIRKRIGTLLDLQEDVEQQLSDDITAFLPPLNDDDVDDEPEHRSPELERLSQRAMALVRHAIMSHTPNSRSLCVQVVELGQLSLVTSRLPEVRQLVVFPDRFRVSSLDHLHQWQTLPSLPIILEGFTNLRTLDLRNVMLKAGEKEFANLPSFNMSALKEVRMHNCCLDRNFLAWILKTCRCLERFQLCVASVSSYDNIDQSQLTPPDLRRLLQQAPMRHTLKDLYLGLEDMALAGSGRVDISAAIFTEYITLEKLSLCTNFEWSLRDEDLYPEFILQLPKSLRYLSIRGVQEDSYQYYIDLRDKAAELKAQFPHLRQISLQDYLQDDGVAQRSAFEALARVGIQGSNCEEGEMWPWITEFAFSANSWPKWMTPHGDGES